MHPDPSNTLKREEWEPDLAASNLPDLEDAQARAFLEKLEAPRPRTLDEWHDAFRDLFGTAGIAFYGVFDKLNKTTSSLSETFKSFAHAAHRIQGQHLDVVIIDDPLTEHRRDVSKVKAWMASVEEHKNRLSGQGAIPVAPSKDNDWRSKTAARRQPARDGKDRRYHARLGKRSRRAR